MKTPYRFQLLALSFFMGTLFALAQSEDWAAESPLVTINGTEVEINSTLTRQSGSLTWSQDGYNTDHTMAFVVNGCSGSWDAQNQLGSLSYELTLNGDPATLTLTGTVDGIALSLTIDNANGQSDSYSFYVETFNLL